MSTKKVMKYEFSCKTCYFELGEATEWTSFELEEQCPCCGTLNVSKKMICVEVPNDNK